MTKLCKDNVPISCKGNEASTSCKDNNLNATKVVGQEKLQRQHNQKAMEQWHVSLCQDNEVRVYKGRSQSLQSQQGLKTNMKVVETTT